jgi:hypothetical protein
MNFLHAIIGIALIILIGASLPYDHHYNLHFFPSDEPRDMYISSN